MDRTDESLIALRRILRATELYERDLAQAAGLTPAQLRVLQIVAERGSVTPKLLANQMGVSQATVTALVDKLVARAFVQRIPSEEDRRQTNLVASEIGRATLENVPDALQLEGRGRGAAFRSRGQRARPRDISTRTALQHSLILLVSWPGCPRASFGIEGNADLPSSSSVLLHESSLIFTPRSSSGDDLWPFQRVG